MNTTPPCRICGRPAAMAPNMDVADVARGDTCYRAYGEITDCDRHAVDWFALCADRTEQRNECLMLLRECHAVLDASGGPGGHGPGMRERLTRIADLIVRQEADKGVRDTDAARRLGLLRAVDQTAKPATPGYHYINARLLDEIKTEVANG